MAHTNLQMKQFLRMFSSVIAAGFARWYVWLEELCSSTNTYAHLQTAGVDRAWFVCLYPCVLSTSMLVDSRHADCQICTKLICVGAYIWCMYLFTYEDGRLEQARNADCCSCTRLTFVCMYTCVGVYFGVCTSTAGTQTAGVAPRLGHGGEPHEHQRGGPAECEGTSGSHRRALRRRGTGQALRHDEWCVCVSYICRCFVCV